MYRTQNKCTTPSLANHNFQAKGVALINAYLFYTLRTLCLSLWRHAENVVCAYDLSV